MTYEGYTHLDSRGKSTENLYSRTTIVQGTTDLNQQLRTCDEMVNLDTCYKQTPPELAALVLHQTVSLVDRLAEHQADWGSDC